VEAFAVARPVLFRADTNGVRMHTCTILHSVEPNRYACQINRPLQRSRPPLSRYQVFTHIVTSPMSSITTLLVMGTVRNLAYSHAGRCSMQSSACVLRLSLGNRLLRLRKIMIAAWRPGRSAGRARVSYFAMNARWSASSLERHEW
jgi:hypothetical protein